MIDLTSKTVVITGGEGFLGRAVSRVVRDRGAIRSILSHKKVNLLDLNDTIKFFSESSADYCIH